MKTALLFAGQATQSVGMGKALFDRFPESKSTFEAADEALGESLSRLIFEGPEADLLRTANAQPAILTVACAAHAILATRGFEPTVLAGHSLGEYGALVAAGALQFADAVRLVRVRGSLMQAAVPEGEGAMAAIQRADDATIAAACAQAGGVCVPAVDNAPGLVVISGETAAVARAVAFLEAADAMVTPLPVSAPFHCSLLAPAAAGLAAALAPVPFGPLRTPYLRNVDAALVTEATADDIRASLVRQVVAPVCWRQSIARMLADGIERFWHLGPGRANLSHVKRQARRATLGAFDTPADLETILKALETDAQADRS